MPTKCKRCGEFNHEFLVDRICFVCARKMPAEIARLEKEIAFWMGEGQDERPEMIEYRSLTNVTPNDRTPEQTSRLIEIAKQLRIEIETEPELRLRIDRLEKLIDQIYVNERKWRTKLDELKQTYLGPELCPQGGGKEHYNGKTAQEWYELHCGLLREAQSIEEGHDLEQAEIERLEKLLDEDAPRLAKRLLEKEKEIERLKKPTKELVTSLEKIQEKEIERLENRTCEWDQTDDDFFTPCGHEYHYGNDNAHTWSYCPGCGGKIVLKQEDDDG